MSNESTLDTLIGQYVQLRDYKDAAADQFKKSMERVNQGLTKLEGLILAGLDKEGTNKVAGKSGTAFTKMVSNVTVADRQAFFKFCMENDQEGLMNIQANKKNVREYLDEAGSQSVPGVKYDETRVVQIRRPKNG